MPGAASPRLMSNKGPEPATAGERLQLPCCRPFHGLGPIFCALILGLAPQALCVRLLRRLSAFFVQSPLRDTTLSNDLHFFWSVYIEEGIRKLFSHQKLADTFTACEESSEEIG